jgi:hypothetical protein
MTQTPRASAPVHTGRGLSYLGFAVVVIVYLAIIQIGGRVISHAADIDETHGFVTTHNLLLTLWFPIGVSLVFTYAVVIWLGWLQPVLHDDQPVNRWVWIVPIVFAVGIAGAIDYHALADKGLAFTVVLLVGTQFVGWAEEGMFRGIGVTMFRRHGMSQAQVAIWSSAVFGAVHLTNAIGRGAQAIPQAIAVSFAGYFFYLIRRVSRGNVLNSVLHGLFDFSILSGTVVVVRQDIYPASSLAILVYVVLAVVLLVRRKHIEPSPSHP